MNWLPTGNPLRRQQRYLRETIVESYLVAKVEQRGGRCDKWICPNRRHVPDRIVLAPRGRLFFVETKAPRGELHPGQVREHDRLRAMGFDVMVIWDLEGVDNFVDLFL